MNTSSKSVPPHGGQRRQIAARFGIQEESLLDLSASINPAGPSASALKAIRRALEDPASLTTYPDLELVKLKQTIATHAGVEVENISVANGFVPLLDAALRSLDIRRCLLPVPCFGEYRRTLENAKTTVFPHQLSAEKNFIYEPDAILKNAIANSCDAILLANPQNPSGVVCDAKHMSRLMETTLAQNIQLLLDEAFIDYCPAQAVARESVGRSNVIVFRSVTKFFAMPGLRIAYAVSNALITQRLHRFISPWPVTTLASEAACAALTDVDYAETSRTINEQRRSWLEHELTKLGIIPYRSSANFLLLRFSAAIDVGQLWQRLIVEQHIILRSCTNFDGLEPNHLRTAVGSERQNERLINALRQILFS